MFKRVAALIIAVFLLALILLTLFWQEVPGIELYSNSPLTKADRISQDLGGKWDSYASLRQAWSQENRIAHNDNGVLTGLIQVNSIVLPSNQGFKVAAKRFRVTGKWGYKTAQLVLEGVYGRAKVFLNGIDEVNYLGEFEGSGGVYNIEISPVRFDFSKDNIIYLELMPGKVQQTKILNWLCPEQGRITGQIRLETVPESTIDLSKTTVSYNKAEQQIIIQANLRHHQSLDYGPWALSGVLKDNGEKIAECLLPLNANGEENQQVELVLNVPEVNLWSINNPYLYELNLVLSNSRGDFDRVQMPIGVRESSYTNGKWFSNSEEVNVNGRILTVAQEYKIRNASNIEDFLISMKSKGVNVLYCMGFFPDEGWLYAADRLGIGIWLEIPMNLTAREKILTIAEMEEIILISERHPSVMAWTAGKGLEPSPQTSGYLQEAAKRLSNKPVYLLLLPGQQASAEEMEIIMTENGIEGVWGKADYIEDSGLREMGAAGNASSNEEGYLTWQEERFAAISWLVWLIFLSFNTLQSTSWHYNALFNPNPKRKIRRALFWSCLGFISRMTTLGAVITSLLFRASLERYPWLPYDTSMLTILKSQNPFLLWLFISFSLVLIKLLQTGLAVSSFPMHPGTLDLTCWLERRNSWIVLIGASWVALVVGIIPWYIPPLLYIVVSTGLVPLRVRDVWKVKGKYSYLFLLPLTVLALAVTASFYHLGDLTYLLRLVLPQISAVLQQFFS